MFVELSSGTSLIFWTQRAHSENGIRWTKVRVNFVFVVRSINPRLLPTIIVIDKSKTIIPITTLEHGTKLPEWVSESSQ